MSCSRRDCTRATFGGGVKVPTCRADTGKGHGGADALLKGLSLPFPAIPLNGQAKTIHTVLEGLLEDHAATARRNHGRCRTSLGDPRTIRTVPATAMCACQQINHSKCYSSFNQRETEHVYYLYKSEIILCYLLKSHLLHHWEAKERSWKRLHVPVPPGTLQLALNVWSEQ